MLLTLFRQDLIRGKSGMPLDWNHPPGSPSAPSAAGIDWNSPPGRAAPPGQETAPEGSVNFGNALTYGIANAIPFSHDIGAAAETYLPRWLSGAPPNVSNTFAENKARINATDLALQRNYPITSNVAPIVSAAATPMFSGPVAGVSELVARGLPRIGPTAATALGSGIVGGAMGALYGAGSGDTLAERERNAMAAAPLGAAGGAAAPYIAKGAGNVAGAVGQYFQGADTAAAKRIGQAAAQNVAAGAPGMSPADVAFAQRAGQPVTVADMLAGPATSRLIGEARDASPEAQAILSTVAHGRYEEQAPRLAGFLRDIFGSNLDAQQARDANVAAAKAANAPNYRAAYAKGANGIWNPDLASLLQATPVKSAVREATNIGLNDSVINGTSPVRNPFVSDAQGNITLGKDANGNTVYPSLQFWDYVKRGLDDQIGTAYRNGQKGLGGQLLGLKSKLLGELDSAVPEYATARQGAFGFFQADDALEAGENFLKMAPTAKTAQMKAQLAAMTGSQKDFFAKGLASQMVQQALNSGASRNIAAMFDKPEIAERINLGLGQYAGPTEAFLRTESIMDRMRTALGNSTTNLKQTDAAKHGIGLRGFLSGALGSPVAGALTGAATAYHEEGFNDPAEMAKRAAEGAFVGLLVEHSGKLNEDTMRAVAQQLTSRDPAVAAKAIQTIGKSPALLNVLRRSQYAIDAAAARYGVPTSDNYAPVPVGAYAKGGAVKSSHDRLVSRLMSLAETAKREEKARTKSILGVPDDAVTTALARANAAI